ncbi:thiosulfate sulfurtransferase/rhodanese-like domain-containing protein 1 [Carassius gibelio]|uniref:thiosulfate sulfurtransferase/rhodanese-like domain-containing protein 1 n=1 Tax=Carassius gibelio TaxID=101364 RepID=UPI00227901F5|nr:thiosulfate sulfurtransferase/rhodanese-like domain-containing protein 1 [Carassius gibelio]
MNTVMHLRSDVCALVALLLLCVSAHSDDQCDNGADNCNKWTETSHNRPLNTDGEVTYEQLKIMISTGSVQLFDVREPDELEAGFIPGATNIPLGDMEQALRLNPDQFRERYSVPKPGIEDSGFVLYCQRGIRSLTALETARDLGYSKARHYAGGYNEWIELDPQ